MGYNGKQPLDIGTAMVVLIFLLPCLGVLALIHEENMKEDRAKCEAIGDTLYEQHVRKGSYVYFCQRPDGALVPIPEDK